VLFFFLHRILHRDQKHVIPFITNKEEKKNAKEHDIREYIGSHKYDIEENIIQLTTN
jgi:hypothetical protein